MQVPAWEDLDTAVGAWLEHAYSEGAAVTLGFINEAAGLLVAFDCMLRSGELYTLKVKDVKFMRNRAVLNLNQSKAGKSAGHSEMVVVESRLAFKWLKQACSGRSKEERLLSKGPAFFRKLFHAMTGFFNAEGLLTVYSLRRGGATWDFLHHQSMERTLLRGRWSTAHTEPLMDPQPARPTVRSYRQQRQMQAAGAGETEGNAGAAGAAPASPTSPASPTPAGNDAAPPASSTGSRGGYGARRGQQSTTEAAGQDSSF
ncbi:unnamed protein product [Effrenium voratum]|nr:unnamed protein product [Effrenium voratum]